MRLAPSSPFGPPVAGAPAFHDAGVVSPSFGRPLSSGAAFAEPKGMILVIVQMKVPYKKRKELAQTIASLSTSIIRSEMGCRRCDFFYGMEDSNVFCLLEEWETREDLETHLNSECFKVLRGAMNLLEEPCTIYSYSSFLQEGIEAFQGLLPTAEE